MDIYNQLSTRYQQLRSQYDAGKITSNQFLAGVQELRTQDTSGTWWAINAEDGSFLQYDGNQWIPSTPQADAQPPPSISKSQITLPKLPKNLRPLLPFAGLVLSTSCGLIWTFYTFLRLGQGEQADCLTPFILGGLPLLLWIFRKPIGAILSPLEPMRSSLPRPLLLGIAFAIPVVLGFLCSTVTSSGYGAMRFVAIISILAAFVLTRKFENTPEPESASKSEVQP